MHNCKAKQKLITKSLTLMNLLARIYPTIGIIIFI